MILPCFNYLWDMYLMLLIVQFFYSIVYMFHLVLIDTNVTLTWCTLHNGMCRWGIYHTVSFISTWYFRAMLRPTEYSLIWIFTSIFAFALIIRTSWKRYCATYFIITNIYIWSLCYSINRNVKLFSSNLDLAYKH